MGPPNGVVTCYYMKSLMVGGLAKTHEWLHLTISMFNLRVSRIYGLFIFDGWRHLFLWMTEEAVGCNCNNELYHSARKPNTKWQVTPDLIKIFSKTGHNCILYFGRFVWPCDQKMCHCDILDRSGCSCVERVTKGQSLFAFSVMSSLTVKGRKGLNCTWQTDWHLSL